MSMSNLVDYFEQIKLLEVIGNKKSKTIVVDDDSDKNDCKARSSQGDANTKKKQ